MGSRVLRSSWVAAPAAPVVILAGFSLVLFFQVASRTSGSAQAAAASAERVVYMVGKLPDEDLIELTTAIVAGDHPGVLLLDSPKSGPRIKAYLEAIRPERVVPLGSFPEGIADLEGRIGVQTTTPAAQKRGTAAFFARAERVVVCPSKPRGLLLQSACLAGALQAPLRVLKNEEGEGEALRRQLTGWSAHEVWAAGEAVKVCRTLSGIRLMELASEEKVAAAAWSQQARKAPIHTIVVANPTDVAPDRSKTSLLATWFACTRRAALLLTNEAGDNTAEVVRTALANPALARADALILLADHKAIPMERRANPVPGKDTWIYMEPFTPSGAEPFTFATGRLFHDDLGILALALARQELLAAPGARTPRKALVVSNPGGGLALMETFSRNTAMELRNRGYETTTLFEEEANPEEVKRLMPEQHIFLWEGHYKTMVEEYGLPRWKEPLQPALIFLQSCLALNEEEALPLFERGAVGLVGSSTRTYSGTGGAFTLAFFDALLYEDQSLGGALRQAKNYLLSYSLLKEKRLGTKAKLGGANLRSAWAFTLWGDPTLKLPQPAYPADALPAVRHQLQGNTIVLTLPDASYPKVTTKDYHSTMWPNARLAGFLSKDAGEDRRRLVPFVFVEVALPQVPPGKTPQLSSKVPASRWVFSWDERRRCGYVLVIPRANETKEVRFQVKWEG